MSMYSTNVSYIHVFTRSLLTRSTRIESVDNPLLALLLLVKAVQHPNLWKQEQIRLTNDVRKVVESRSPIRNHNGDSRREHPGPNRGEEHHVGNDVSGNKKRQSTVWSGYQRFIWWWSNFTMGSHGSVATRPVFFDRFFRYRSKIWCFESILEDSRQEDDRSPNDLVPAATGVGRTCSFGVSDVDMVV